MIEADWTALDIQHVRNHRLHRRKQVLPILIDGLRRLEYRGYDSAGVAVVRNGTIELRRSAGKLARLEEAIARDPARRRVRHRPHPLGDPRPSDRGERASAPRLHRPHRRRPQRDHRELSRSEEAAAAEGHKFVTETDTEIVAHLVEREMKDDGLENAVRRALLYMRGLFALVLISADDPEQDRRRPQRPADRRRARRRASSSSRRTSRPSSRTRATSCSWATRRWRSSRAAGVEFTDYSGRACRRRARA